MSIEAVEVIAAILVAVIFMWVRYAEKHISHGEARFDENGKLIEDE